MKNYEQIGKKQWNIMKHRKKQSNMMKRVEKKQGHMMKKRETTMTNYEK